MSPPSWPRWQSGRGPAAATPSPHARWTAPPSSRRHPNGASSAPSPRRNAYWRAGRGARAEELLQGALAEVRDPLLRADAEQLLGTLTHFGGDPLAARDILASGALRIEREDPRRAADLMVSALHASWFCARPELVRETAETAARLATSSGAERDTHMSAMAGAALTVCERLDFAEPYLRRGIDISQRARRRSGSLMRPSATRGCASTALLASSPLGRATPRSSREQRDRSPSRPSCYSEYQWTLGEYDAAGAAWTEAARLGGDADQPHTVAWSTAPTRLSRGHSRGRRAGPSSRRRARGRWKTHSGSSGPTLRLGCWRRPRSRAATARLLPTCSRTRSSTFARRTTRLGRPVPTSSRHTYVPESRSSPPWRSASWRRTRTRAGRAPPWTAPGGVTCGRGHVRCAA